MLTIDTLSAYGADVKTGLARCMGMTDFYLRLVNKELSDVNFSLLEEAMNKGDAKAAFEAGHALKGAAGNLALTPIYEPVCELTEKLRNAEAIPDTGDLLEKIMKALTDLKALAE